MATKAKEKSLGAATRFGVRYGRSLKQTFGQIEHEHRRLHACPYCAYTQVKRVSAGIWQCRKCNAKFTGRAYTLSQPADAAIAAEVKHDEAKQPEQAVELVKGES